MHENLYEYTAVESHSKSIHTHTSKISSKKRSKIVSFNVRGLSQESNRHHLAQDLARYNIDICCLQEFKVSELSDEMEGSFRVILLPGKCRRYGLGFALNEHWTKILVTYESIDDRIAVAMFKLSERAFMKVAHVYAPTQAKSNALPSWPRRSSHKLHWPPLQRPPKPQRSTTSRILRSV